MNKNNNNTFYYIDVPVFIAAGALWSVAHIEEAFAKLDLSFADRLAVWGDVGMGTIIAMAIMATVSSVLGFMGGMKIDKLIDKWGI